MSKQEEPMHDEWSPEEYAHIRSLFAERIPPYDLKRRTIESARAAGYVCVQQRRTVRTLALLAAASLIFVAGTVLGYSLARRTTPPARTAGSANSQAVATTGFTINNDPRRRIVWY